MPHQSGLEFKWNYSRWKSIAILGFTCLIFFDTRASSVNQIQNKIHKLENQLQTDHKGLSQTEQKLLQQTERILLMQNALTKTKQTIIALQDQITSLKQQYYAQQKKLMQHLNARYSMQRKPTLSQQRFYVYYQYILQSDIVLFRKIAQMREAIGLKEISLKKTLQKQMALEIILKQQQLVLIRQKKIKQSSLRKLEYSLRYEQKNLNILFKKISHQHFQNVHVSLATIHHKWPWPIQQKPLKYTKVNQGMLLSARENEPVHAILPGKILFSHWFNGYGYLIIIDHGRGYYSLYANNKKLYKPDGSYVTQGETIASVGHSGNLKRNGLYFELRHQGKAVSPLAWLA